MHPPDITALLSTALAEDIGAGDITSLATIPADRQTIFVMNARQEMVVSGLVFLPQLFELADDYFKDLEATFSATRPHPEFAQAQIQTSPKGEVAPAAPVEKNTTAEVLIKNMPLRTSPLGEVEKCSSHFSGEGVVVTLHVAEGDKVPAGTALATLRGSARALLSGERVALNLVQQLSGVATLTRQYVEAVAGTGATILDTRKTVLGMRHAQKYAVTCGGGRNHRMGLYDAVLIKDNHIAVAGGMAAAINAARAYLERSPHPEFAQAQIQTSPKGEVRSGTVDAPRATSPLGEVEKRPSRFSGEGGRDIPLEVECDTLAQLAEALAAGVDVVLLDNMDNASLREAVATVRAHNLHTGQCVKTEASGNVSLATVRAIAETGVDAISIGKLTHSAIAVDIGLDEG